MFKRGIKPLTLFATMFVVLCGGPFGIEEIVPLAGPGLFVLVLLVVPVVWAIPSALIVAELVSELPAQGGAYQWFRAWMGPFGSFVFTYLEWLSWALDSALYPALLAAYMTTAFFEPDPWLRGAVCLGVIWGCAWLNIRGVKDVGRLSIIMAVVILVPVIAMVLLSVPKLSPSVLLPLVPDGQPFSSALNYALIWAIWSYSGYGGLAAASEEIEEPERTYPKILAIFIPISVATYVLPLLAGLAASPDWQNWGPAHLSVAAFALGGTWLAVSVATAAQVATLGLYNGEQLILGRYVYAMARDGLLPPSLAKLHPRHDTPAVALIFHAFLFSGLVLIFDFVELLVLGALVSVPTYLLTFACPIVLRWKRPDLRGPFRIPGGWPVLIPAALIPSLIAIYLVVAASPTERIGAGLFIGSAPLVYFAARRYNLYLGIDSNAPNPSVAVDRLLGVRPDQDSEHGEK